MVHRLTVVCILPFLVACVPAVQEPPAVAQTLSGPGVCPLPVERQFDKHSLRDLLLAELAMHRQQTQIAAQLYLQQASVTGDPAVIARAALLARRHLAPRQALAAARLQFATRPQSLSAWHDLLQALLATGEHQQELPGKMQQLHATWPRGGLAGLLIRAMYCCPAQLDDLQRALQQLQRMEQAQGEDDMQLAWLRGRLLYYLGDSEAALRVLPAPLHGAADEVLFYARVLSDAGRHAAAAELLGAVPGQEMHLGYLLLDARQYQAAYRQFEQLLGAAQGDESDVRLVLAWLDIQLEHYEQAHRHLQQIIDAGGRRTDAAWRYKGLALLQQGAAGAAAVALMQVGPGAEFLAAQALLATALLQNDAPQSARADLRAHFNALRAAHGQYRAALWSVEARALLDHVDASAALQVLHEALQQAPDSLDLYRQRSFVYLHMGDLPAAEKDLRFILKAAPESATALNDLGYVLADRTDRIDEARALVTRAIQLRPQDPDIVDSMGWVEYRDGNYQGAARLLRQAFAGSKDPVIGTHLGEVLWMLGEPDDACAIWRQVAVQEADSPELRETLQRLLGEAGAGSVSGVLARCEEAG